jgi:hypothetical protein
MIDPGVIQSVLKAPDDKPDTEEQAQLRACLINVISGHNEVDTIRICGDLINLMRDQLSTGTASVRRLATAKAKEIMSPADIATGSGQTRQTIARLLTESRGI